MLRTHSLKTIYFRDRFRLSRRKVPEFHYRNVQFPNRIIQKLPSIICKFPPMMGEDQTHYHGLVIGDTAIQTAQAIPISAQAESCFGFILKMINRRFFARGRLTSSKKQRCLLHQPPPTKTEKTTCSAGGVTEQNLAVPVPPWHCMSQIKLEPFLLLLVGLGTSTGVTPVRPNTLLAFSALLNQAIFAGGHTYCRSILALLLELILH